ncbi:MAG: hypothetical protein J2P41_22150, partial [Blastocatellia bacterium]|nr:hypothetical protein [Blastocatellia bacterium]
VLLVDEKKFEEASIKLANAVKIDPRVREAWEQLGFAQYRLGHYTQSLDAENRAVSLGESFTSLYTMGLVHFALKDWVKARESLSNAVHYCDATAWNDSCAEAYEDLARSIFELADAKYTIESLEQRGAGKLPDQERFMLAVLYLQIGDTSAATQHYQILKGSSPMMAQELGRLLGVGKPPSLQKKPESIFEFSLKAPVRGTPNASWSAGAV